MVARLAMLIGCVLLVGAPVPCWAGDEDLEAAAEPLLVCTLTVRMVNTARPSDIEPLEDGVEVARREPDADRDDVHRAADGVTVCTGFSLGDGLVVSALRPGPGARFRITLAGGQQAEAELRVADRYSGLVLLEVDKLEHSGLKFADELPRVGGRVLSAAAWGVEAPVVSHGILSGANRSIPGTTLPPLLQCDLRTTKTSAGAAVVDRHGKLVGVIIAAEAPGDLEAWAYAVPMEHVRRLVNSKQPGRTITLERRRPLMGVILKQGPQPGTVQVQRVTPGGPAEAAGIREGDLIVEADGVKLRTPYDATRMVMNRQPGDRVALVVEQQERQEQRTVTLGGGEVVEPQAYSAIAGQRQLIDPSVNVLRRGPGFEVQQGAARARNGQEMIEEAAARYLALIEQKLERVRQLEAELAERDAQIEQLRRQVRELEQAKPAPVE
jgi:S1-C subfamily serine protease